MRLIVCGVMLLAPVAAAVGEQLTNEQRAFFQRCEVATKQLIPFMARSVQLQKGLVNRIKSTPATGRAFPSKAAKQEALLKAEATLAVMESELRKYKSGEKLAGPPLIRADVGAIGTLAGSYEIVQVVDDANMLVSGKIGVAGPEQTYWVKGLATDNVADDERARSSHVFRVMETKQYTTAIGGSNTVYVLEVFDMDQLTPLYKQFKAEK